MNNITDFIEIYFQKNNSVIARDLKLNLKRLLLEGALTQEEALLALLAIAKSVEHSSFANFAYEALTNFELNELQLQEALESAAIVAMLNIYYRFQHMINKPDYTQAGLRMTALAKPLLGKERFEMLAFAVSVINGCEKCMSAHEQTLRDQGVNIDKIHDLARLAAIIKGIKTLNE